MKHFSEQQRRERVVVFMAGVQTQELGEKARETTVPTLSERSVKVLVKAALEPGTWLLEVYRALGLHPAEGKAALDDLLARGMVKQHRLTRKGRGGQPVVVEVLTKGAAELAKRGIVPAERVLKGGFKHDCYGRRVGNWAAKQGNRCWYERTLGGKTFDLVYEDQGEELHGVEICLTGSAKWNAQQLLKAACVEGIIDVTAACETKAFLKAIMQEVKEMDGLELCSKKIKGKLLADYLESKGRNM